MMFRGIGQHENDGLLTIFRDGVNGDFDDVGGRRQLHRGRDELPRAQHFFGVINVPFDHSGVLVRIDDVAYVIDCAFQRS